MVVNGDESLVNRCLQLQQVQEAEVFNHCAPSPPTSVREPNGDLTVLGVDPYVYLLHRQEALD